LHFDEILDSAKPIFQQTTTVTVHHIVQYLTHEQRSEKTYNQFVCCWANQQCWISTSSTQSWFKLYGMLNGFQYKEWSTLH